MVRYKTYYNEDEEKDKEFTVFIIHANSPEINKVEQFINEDLNFNTTVLGNSFNGNLALEKFKDELWENADCVIAILSPDADLNSGESYIRQNLFYQLGYCRAIFDAYYDEFNSEAVFVIQEKSISLGDLSNLLGLENTSYTSGTIESTFQHLRIVLTNLYNEVSGDEDDNEEEDDDDEDDDDEDDD